MKCKVCGKLLNEKEIEYAKVLECVCSVCTIDYMHELALEGEEGGIMPCPNYRHNPQPGHNCWETCSLDNKRGQTCIGMLNCSYYKELGDALTGN